MQSYSIYYASEFLKDRHPYIPDPNPRPLIDPEQVAVSYNERAIPKLADLLIYEQLTPEKRRDALHTLNELVSHQETKSDMITNKIVLSATCLMVDSSPEVRYEAAMLVGSLFFLETGRLQFDQLDGNYSIMQTLIFDPVQKVRESVGWLLHRLSMHKDGTLMMNKSRTIYKMVDAFNFFSNASMVDENIYYILYLLEAMINLSRYDYNIEHMLKKGLLASFNIILSDEAEKYSSALTTGLYRQLRELVLNTAQNIALIAKGKVEGYQESLIITGSKYLNSELENERLYASSLFMSISNILDSKKQICKFAAKENPNRFEILEKICISLEDKNYDIKHNSIYCLRNLAELPEGFLKIIDILHEKLELMNEVFGVNSLKGLTELLPKLSKYKNPPHVEKEMLPKYLRVIRAIIYFYKKYQDDALDILIHDTVNINQKLGPFCILNDSNPRKLTKYLTDRIGKKDPHNQQILAKFIEEYDINVNSTGKEKNDSLQLSEIIK